MYLLAAGQKAQVRHTVRIFAILAVLVFAFARLSFTQSFTSSITGLVTDPTGAPVQGAAVELKNMATNDVRTVQSGANGAYDFQNLAPGTYQITTTARGFKTFQQQNLTLRANTGASVNVSLEIGGTEQRIEVTAASTLVDTETANNSVTMDSHLINALPNSTRNPLNFVFAIAGTTEAPGGQTQKSGTLDQLSSNFGINGGRTGDEQILIDGAASQAIDWGGLVVSPLQDSVQEQQIIQNTYDAQYERGGAGIVTLITKGGSNQFHGEAYDYLQNSALNANSWFNNKNDIAKGQFKQNQFGGNVSGPILKRWNLFFFGGYEGLRQPNTQSTGLITVPTKAERGGDFSHSLNADGSPAIIYNPFQTTTANNTTGYTRAMFAGNIVPTPLFNPVGVKMVNLFPLPNRPGLALNNQQNYYAQGAGQYSNDKMDTRVDWEQSSNHRLFVRWSDRFRQDQTLPCFFCNGADTGVNQTNNGFQVVLNDTITPSPTWVINTFATYSRWRESHIAQGFGVADASTVGLSPALFQAPVLPTISSDGPYTGLGSGTYENFVRYSNSVQINLTKQLSNNTLKFGASFDVQQINVINEVAGNFSFSSAQTSCDPDPSGVCSALNTTSILTGNPVASMLLGTASGGSQGINPDPAESVHTYGVYIQDQWRVTPRFTVNVGLRYENQRPATERFNRLTYFDPGVVNPVSAQIAPLIGHPVFGGFEYANSSNRYGWQPNNYNPAPRIGLAYKITDKLVARAGAGIFYLGTSALIGDDGGQQIGFSSNTSYVATNQNGFVPANLVNNPFPQGVNQPTGSSQGLLTQVGSGINGIWLKGYHPTPYTEQWSFDLQYQVSSHAVVEAGYTGNRGRKLLYGNINLDADQLPDRYLKLGPQLDAQVPNPWLGIADPTTYYGSPSTTTIAYNLLLRPYPQFTNLQYTRSLPGARSAFDAMYLKYNQTFSAGLSLLTTYQWSKALDNGPEDNFGWATGNQWRDANNTMLDYNISTHDVPQSFATALVYDLPYGKGKKWGSSAPAVVREVLGNWQVSSVIRIASGLPLFGVINGGNNHLNNYGFPGPELPNLVGNPVPSHRTPDNWINPNAYQTLASAYGPIDSQFVLGNAPQRMTQLRERAARNVDLSVAKNLGGERVQAWLRGEFINSFNYAQYNNICTDLTNSSGCGNFGVAQNTENQPRTVQVSLKLSF